ncbi:lipid II flippase Amj family protein [Paenibacillus apiarius]|uniref:Lipid II flippase Amj n=1 Tax=Paenibacillus apiarius TaxID=46240 RepID=A0ABT4DMT6_9BACL|nr:lipid II flippase Amj family protein [Paenibacillus apiarius]MBN3522457.1 lipid II flippase Amj family protein [Paenibacillus apiarius]MCY9514687.1 lipid II flippase Amj family protein [Paenibacillus apiarius]MCY9518677.1 lipid II flippase Amj family protein [Paenibacillus apiarius]MCY9552882.1 lipid II flippase Amj family protein [Paenibacillus apiarius]MCY9556907.1 lipid II flippase Amj family protein [Paenibacillus apiarius]
MTDKIIVIALFTLCIHMFETLSYAVRYAGVRVGRLAVSLSLTGIIVLVSRTSNLIQAPMTGKVIDYARERPEFDLESNIRIIIGSSTIGTLLALLLFPTAVLLATRVIRHLEVSGSIPKMITSVSLDQLKHVKHHIRKPTWKMLASLRIMGIPKRLLLLNSCVTGIYTIGVMSALYASVLTAEFSTAASQSSGFINGVATVLLTIFVDPQMAMLTDRAIADTAARQRLGKIFALLIMSRALGTVLAQLFFYPAALWISWIVQYL